MNNIRNHPHSEKLIQGNYFQIGDDIICIHRGLDFERVGQRGPYDYKEGDIGKITGINPGGSLDVFLRDGREFYQAQKSNWIKVSDYLKKEEKCTEQVVKGRLIELGDEPF